MKKSMIAMMAAAAMSAGVFAVQAGEQDTPTKLYNYLSSRKAGDKAALSCYTKATQKSMENFARAKEAAEKNGETAEKAPKEAKKPAAKKKTVKKTLPWMTKTTNRFKKLKDEAVQELTAKQQEQYAKALAKYEAEKAAEKAKKAAEKKAAAKKPAARKKTTAKENPDE